MRDMSVGEASEYNPVAIEENILKCWRNRGIMKKTLESNRKETFSFLEGPPTANAPPALHHVEVRVFKDLVNRYHFMKGFAVPRKAGWDCHGLPVEVQVEKKLNLENKKDIEEYGVDKFVEECRNSVFTHIKEWDRLTERMAYWIDLEKPYITMDSDYIESVWWSLKQIYDKGLLYEGYRVVPYCPRCGTPLSSHEVAQGYKSVKDETVIVPLAAKERDFSLLAWTTTPWTLLSNVALAVNPEVDYAVIKYEGEKYVLAKNLAQARFPEAEILETVKGKDLVGVEYYPLFSHFVGKLEKPAWRVISGGFVTTEDGTGIVHIAPAFGEDDYNAGVENNLPLANPLDADGKFTSQVPELEGVFAKDADPKIITILEESGKLIAKFPYTHEYPFCWRCNTPLLYYAMKSWFIKVSEIVQKLVEKNSEINWYPEHVKEGRFGKWLENARDWSLSRNRFWGTPLPIWICQKCGGKKMVGSRKELLENARGIVDENIDLHRPYVDEVKFKCECGGEMERVPYVIDCWYDSGSAPYAQFHYPFENQDEFKKRFPYDFISEATDQTRGWFYTLHVLSTILFEKPAYKTCVVGGLLLDDAGEKMSKSKNNIINPWELFNTVGADAVRLQMCSTAPWNAVRFGIESLNEAVIPFLRTLWNCYSFTAKYMALDKFTPGDHNLADCELMLEDEWILASLANVVKNVTDNMEENNYHIAFSTLNNFVVEDLSRWYIKLIRDRLWIEDKEIDEGKKTTYMVLTEVFMTLTRLLAPFTPFIAEEIHLNFSKAESVHLEGWPTPGKIDLELITQMDVARKIFEAGSYCRQNAGIKLRHPISSLRITGDETVKKTCENLSDVIRKQLNTKKVEYLEKMDGLSFEAKPDFKQIGPVFGKDANKAAKAITENPDDARKIKESGVNGEIAGFKVSPEMILEIKINVPKGVSVRPFTSNNACGIVYIDEKQDECLMREALARDLIRNIQALRKTRSLDEMERISLKIQKNDKILEMLVEFQDTILSEVRAMEITLTDKLETEHKFIFEGVEIPFDFSF
ncbi:MAG TPA: isoleucine--tRNA ligase [Candidatus Altiarchaeales archaeon]|nr:isoleucine--tRNA ligase [Candidatus Altiarchaeales archaeon]